MRLWCSIVVLVAMVGCMTNPSVAVDVDARAWQSTVHLEVSNSDTITLRDINLFMRCEQGMVADSIELNVMTVAPDGSSYSEDFTIHMPQSSDRKSNVRFIEQCYRQRVRLVQRGAYSIYLRPYAVYKGVESWGVSVSPHKSIKNGKI